MRRVRIGAVGYLNTRPLVHGLDRRPEFDVRFDVPSRCATLLHERMIDLGVVPSIELTRGDYRIVPGIAIASEGEVASVALFMRCPLDRVRRVALDTSSRTSATLLRVLFAERFGLAPVWTEHPPDIGSMLLANDAALVIGDPALFFNHEAAGLMKLDLGAAWTEWTGLPFVWAFWAGHHDAVSPDVVGWLTRARDEGVAAIDAIAADYAQGDAARAGVARRYLRTNVQWVLTARHVEALRRFYALAAKVGVVARDASPLFFSGRGHA
jgi:chorismate dehydratase